MSVWLQQSRSFDFTRYPIVGLGDCASDFQDRLQSNPQYVYKGSQWVYSVPAYLPLRKTVGTAQQEVRDTLQRQGYYDITVSHPGGYSEAPLVIRATTPIDRNSENDTFNDLHAAADSAFYLRSGVGSIYLAFRPDPCGGSVGSMGTYQTPTITAPPDQGDSSGSWLDDLASSLGLDSSTPLLIGGTVVVALLAISIIGGLGRR